MKKKAKLYFVALLTLAVSGIIYSKVASAAACYIIGESIYCF